MCNVGYWYDEWFQENIDLIKGYNSSWIDNLHPEEQPIVEYEDYKEERNDSRRKD